jgi:L-asparaginase
MQSHAIRLVVLGMGGTIAGRAASAHDNVGYVAGVAPIEELVASAATTTGAAVESESVAQIDSKDLGWDELRRLIGRVAHHAARADVRGIVVTHGTDTLEETAYALHRTHPGRVPVVITGAMRPASSLQADGPQNLRDALTVAADAQARGVLVAMAGRVHAGAVVRKVHPYRLDAFSSGDAGAVALVEEGAVRWLREPREDAAPIASEALAAPWPWIEIVTAAAGAEPRAVDALLAAGVQGLVVAATGNGTLHGALEAALERAVDAGVPVLRATRCCDGRVIDAPGESARLPSAGALTPMQARIELALRQLAARA